MEEESKRPVQLNECEVKYELFILEKNHQYDTENEISGRVSAFYEEMLAYVESLTVNYMWNNQKFNLTRPVKQAENTRESDVLVYTCKGLVDYGDNLEDEWFIVHLLHKLTARYEERLAARIVDYDGEFLLIHCANYLPEWASTNENNCMENRVFIYMGKVHIIPPANNPAQITYLPANGPIRNSTYAARIVYNFPNVTLASGRIQECIQHRISLYEPADVLEKHIYHRVNCIIPVKLAYLLKNNPSLISTAVNRFCENDPADAKHLRGALETFKPVDLVNFRVLFTKHLYGKLKYFDFKKSWAKYWPSAESLAEQNPSLKPELVKERAAMGFKLTGAFELMAKTHTNDTTASNFENYLSRLNNMGYFKDYIENSKNYNELLEKAKISFNNTECEPSTGAKRNSTADSATANLTESFSLVSESDVAKLKEELANLNEMDDNDDWLCVEAPQLDDYLEMYSKGDVSSTYDFKILTRTMKNFIQKLPTRKQDILGAFGGATSIVGGVDFKAINRQTNTSTAGKQPSESGKQNPAEQLIDFNTDSIEDNLKDLLSKASKPAASASTSASASKLIEDLEHDDDESDSFYEIDDDLVCESDDENLNNKLKNYMSLMDDEIKEEKNMSRVGGAKKNKAPQGEATISDDEDDEDDENETKDLDIDMNLVTNALESYSSQLGLSGPVSNILKSLGL